MDIYKDFRIGALQDKFSKADQELEDFKCWENNPEKVCPLTEDDRSLMNQLLSMRTKSIADVVDWHVENLLNELRNEVTSDLASQIRNLRTGKKLILLELNQGTLRELYKRDKTPCLRMKGITQSYYMYDSVMYKNLKPIIKEIKSESNRNSMIVKQRYDEENK